MNNQNNSRTSSVLLLLVGMTAGWWLSTMDPAVTLHADDRKKLPKTAFQSGSERSVAVLENISRQIDVLDRRLERIEATVVGKSKVPNSEK